MNGMSQEDLRRYFENCWQSMDGKATVEEQLRYSSPVEDAVLYPVYKDLLCELGAVPDDKRVLDIGSGSGRWIRFFLANYSPAHLTGIDLAESSVALLRKWYTGKHGDTLTFHAADITAPDLSLSGPPYDLINIANVLFHIVEPVLFLQALRNIAHILAPGGIAVTTEYLPRTTLRTNMMVVYSRTDFQAALAEAGLEIVKIKAFSFFSNDPMGLDLPEEQTRTDFNKVRAGIKQMLSSAFDDETRRFLLNLFITMEHALLSFCKKRMEDVDFPSQKLVVLRHRPV